jgi:CRP/FNR family transcriptional regulator
MPSAPGAAMERTVETLRKLPLSARLGDEALRAVAGRTVARTVPAGRILFRRGAPAEGLYVVIGGAVRVDRSNRQGGEQTLRVQGPGQPLAEVPLFEGGPYPASTRAETESRVLFLPPAATPSGCTVPIPRSPTRPSASWGG